MLPSVPSRSVSEFVGCGLWSDKDIGRHSEDSAALKLNYASYRGTARIVCPLPVV